MFYAYRDGKMSENFARNLLVILHVSRVKETVHIPKLANVELVGQVSIILEHNFGNFSSVDQPIV